MFFRNPRTDMLSSRRSGPLADVSGWFFSAACRRRLPRAVAGLWIVGLWIAAAHGQQPQVPGGVTPLPQPTPPAAAAVDEANRIVEVRIPDGGPPEIARDLSLGQGDCPSPVPAPGPRAGAAPPTARPKGPPSRAEVIELVTAFGQQIVTRVIKSYFK
jgi:hypothetical protein